MLPGNQFAMGIQSKNVRGLGAEPPVGSMRSETPNEPGVSGGRASLTQEIFRTLFSKKKISAPKFDDIFFPIFLQSSETHFDLITSKHFPDIIYDDIVVYF